MPVIAPHRRLLDLPSRAGMCMRARMCMGMCMGMCMCHRLSAANLE
jgi:hypothetical protein